MAAMTDDHEIHIPDDPSWHRVTARDVSADGAPEKELEAEFPAARTGRNDGALEARLKAVLERLSGVGTAGTGIDLPLAAISRAETQTYKEIATQIGVPKAARASGRLTGYRWGLDRKKKLLAREWTGRPKDGP